MPSAGTSPRPRSAIQISDGAFAFGIDAIVSTLQLKIHETGIGEPALDGFHGLGLVVNGRVHVERAENFYLLQLFVGVDQARRVRNRAYGDQPADLRADYRDVMEGFFYFERWGDQP